MRFPGRNKANGPRYKEKGEPPKEDDIGAWLCNKGPYQQYIAALSRSNPGLTRPDPANKNIPLEEGYATVVLLEAPATGPAKFVKIQFRDSKKLAEHFEQINYAEPKRRIYLMDGLAPDYIAAIGGHFFMEPTFFQRQERTCVWSNDFTPTSDALPQPSLLDPDKMFHLQYCELRHFLQDMENAPYFCGRTGRHVGMTKARAERTTTGILRRKISFWSRTTPQNDKGWDAVILCDPQLTHLVKGGKKLEYINEPFQDGYIDFLPPPAHDSVTLKEKHPHHSMLRDLCYYFEKHSASIEESKWENPISASFFLKKIVCAHYLQLVDYIKAMLPSLELHLTTAWIDEQDQWKNLQTISRRCGNYRDDIEDTLLSLGIALKEPDPIRKRDWRDTEKDFQYIYMRLGILKSRADTLMQAMTGLASIAGNRQNLEEAKRVKRLNLLALLFIPLAYTSSLFSMQDSYAPGAGKFWIYWVSSLPIIAFTFFMTWLLDSALDDAAQWTWRPLRWLKFWEYGDGAMAGPRPKRQKTIYG